MATLMERVEIDVADRDRAMEALRQHGYVLDVEAAGGDEDRYGKPRAILVVRSADDVVDPSSGDRQAFATAIGDLLDHAEIEGWKLVARPSPFVNFKNAAGEFVRGLRSRRP